MVMSPFAGGEPVITKSIHHDNFISEFETNLDCTDTVSYTHLTLPTILLV